MLIFKHNPNLKLVELSDLAHPYPHPFVRQYQNEFQEITDWCKTFLCNPHKDLGRKGPICPYLHMSMNREVFWQTAFSGQPSLDEVRNIILDYRDWFLTLDPIQGRESKLKSILILFPDLSPDRAPEIIDGIQAELKLEFVQKGLMIGQFHARNQEPGLWNKQFRPLRTPIPLLAIRYMVPSDIAFLSHDDDLLAAYVNIFGEESLKCPA